MRLFGVVKLIKVANGRFKGGGTGGGGGEFAGDKGKVAMKLGDAG